jgi:hypothetical protein
VGYGRRPERLIDGKAELYPCQLERRAWPSFTRDVARAAVRLRRDPGGEHGIYTEPDGFTQP